MRRMMDQNHAADREDARYAARLWLTCVALPCLALLAIAAVATIAEARGGTITATEHRAAEICFPARLWHSGRAVEPPHRYVSPEDRPCDVIGRPEEDGSGYLTLGTLGAGR